MHTYHKVLIAKHEDSGDHQFQAIFPYYVFRSSWYHYLELLDIDYPHGFTCPKCSSMPDIIVCDATSLAFRRQLLKVPTLERPSDTVLDGW